LLTGIAVAACFQGQNHLAGKRDGGEERAELEIQLLPGKATRRGWVIFQGDPAEAAKMTAHPVGFQRP
jgi:hypothetical protein